jgi:hypothetical protein
MATRGRVTGTGENMFLRRRHALIVLLLASSLTGCKESPSWVKEGPLFTATEKASPGGALVYVYWPREEQGGRDRLWIGPCEEGAEEMLPGSYRSFVVEPGSICLGAKKYSEIAHMDMVSVSQHLASVELTVTPDRPSFLRIEQKQTFLTSGTVLRPVAAAVADPEIKRCRQMVPLTDEEMRQIFSREDQ